VFFFVSSLHFENNPFLPLVQPTYLKTIFEVRIQIPVTYKSQPLLLLLTIRGCIQNIPAWRCKNHKLHH
jgi:hypothetical protein